MANKMNIKSLQSLADFFLTVGNGETYAALRGVVDDISNGVSLDQVFKKIVAQARIQARQGCDPFSRLKNWATIAANTKDAADFAEAEALMSKIQSPNQRAPAKKILARAYAKAGRLGEARTRAHDIKSAYWRAEAYLEIYGVSKEAGDLVLAKDAADRIINPDAQDEVMAQIGAAKRNT